MAHASKGAGACDATALTSKSCDATALTSGGNAGSASHWRALGEQPGLHSLQASQLHFSFEELQLSHQAHCDHHISVNFCALTTWQRAGRRQKLENMHVLVCKRQ